VRHLGTEQLRNAHPSRRPSSERLVSGQWVPAIAQAVYLSQGTVRRRAVEADL